MGLSIGSFLNVVIARVPEGLSIVSPRSRCPKCGHELPWYENIPVVSWLMLRGRCSGCKTPISPRYILVELLTGTLFVVATVRFPFDWPLVSALVFISILIPLIFIDAEHWILPFELTLPGIALGLGLALLGGKDAFVAALVGATAGFLAFRVMEFFGWYATGREALGAGDKYLLAMIGAQLGWRPLLGVVLFSSLQGAAYGLVRMKLTGRAGPTYGGEPGKAAARAGDATGAGQPGGEVATTGATATNAPAKEAATPDATATDAAATQATAAGAEATNATAMEAAPTANAAPTSAAAAGDGATPGAVPPSAATAGDLPLGETGPAPDAPGDDDGPWREPFTPAFLAPGIPAWKRLALVPYALFLQDIPDSPPADEETGEEPEWTPGASNMPFGPWIGLAALEVMFLGPALVESLAHTPFRLTAQILFGR
jgi:leader peptidase (prepilin peptidase)/N-methyltransferase